MTYEARRYGMFVCLDHRQRGHNRHYLNEIQIHTNKMLYTFVEAKYYLFNGGDEILR